MGATKAFQLDLMDEARAMPVPGAITSQSAKQQVYLRSRGACERCSQKATQVHHLTYARHGHERATDLEHLCDACHHAAHYDAAGNFWLHEQDRLDYWAGYEVEMGKA